MDIAYYFIGLLGDLLAPFIGKELYKYYTKYTIQQKLDRILKLNDKLKRLNDFNSEHVQFKCRLLVQATNAC
jgi:hypothetical protein